MERFFYYTSNQGKGRTYPVVKNEKGVFMVYDRKDKRLLPQFTDKLLHDNGIHEKGQLELFEMKCVEVKVNSIDDLCAWLERYDKISSEIKNAEETLHIAKNILHNMLKENTYMYPDVQRITYAETKAMGCTDIVYRNDEQMINPKTGNEFFAPEDAKKTFETIKKEHAGEIENEFNEVWTASNYIWEEADLLDDLIMEETTNGPLWSKDTTSH